MKPNSIRKQKSSSKPVISAKFPSGFFHTTKNVDIHSPRNSDPDDTKKLTKVLKHLNKMPDQSTEKLFHPYFELSSTFSHTPILPIQIEDLITLSQASQSELYTSKRAMHSQTLDLFSVHQLRILNKEVKNSLRDMIDHWQSLKNPSLLRVLQCFWNIPEGCLSLVSQYYSGTTLQDLCETVGSLPETVLHTIAINLLKLAEWAEENGKKIKTFDISQVVCTKDGEIKLAPRFLPENSQKTEDSLLMGLGKILLKAVWLDEFETSEQKCCFFHSLKENPIHKRLSKTFQQFLCKLTSFQGSSVKEVMREPWMLQREYIGALVSLEEIVKLILRQENIKGVVDRVCESLKVVLSGKKFCRPSSPSVSALAHELDMSVFELKKRLDLVYNEVFY